MSRSRLKIAIALGLAMLWAADAQARICTPFDGSFIARFDSDVPGPPYPPGYTVHCPSSTLFPVRQCTHGQLFDLAGVFVATYEFGFTSQSPADDGTLRFTGVSDITLLAGDVIHGTDHGYLRPSPDADGQVAAFETTVEPYAISSGGRTRPLRTAVDTPGNPDDVSLIVAGPGGTGSLNLIEGTSSGAYVGQICPKL